MIICVARQNALERDGMQRTKKTIVKSSPAAIRTEKRNSQPVYGQEQGQARPKKTYQLHPWFDEIDR